MVFQEWIELSEGDRKLFASVKELIKSTAKTRGREFTKALHESWKVFYNMPPYQQHGLVMNYTSLGQAADSFWEDMLRIKSFHDIEYGDRHKLAAHIFKWLSRMRPIKPINDHSAQQAPEFLQANALFALACAQSFLDCSDFSGDENQYILYSSTYRDIHAREWSMIFYLLEKQHPKT